MSIVNITLGEQTDNVQIDISVLPMIELHLKSLEAISGFLQGTDSDSWLVEAENNG